MPFAALPLAVTLAALTPGAGPEASTYDQATCAALRGEKSLEGLGNLDGWDRAAIGELTLEADDACPTAAVQLARTTACAEETDPVLRRHLAQLWGDRLETCYLPRINANRAGLRALRRDDVDSRRLPRLLLGQLSDTDGSQPLPQPERRDTVWALVSAPQPVPGPSSVDVSASFRAPPPLSSISHQPSVPPPRS